MRIENLSSEVITYSPPFVLERRTGDGWKKVNRHQTFTLPLLFLEPGEATDWELVAVYIDSPVPRPLGAGIYRVSREISFGDPGSDDQGRDKVLRARFRVAD